MQSLQVVNEVVRSYGLGVHSSEADALLRYGSYYTSISLVHITLVNSQIRVGLAVATCGERTLGEVHFVEEENPPPLLFGVI